MKSKSKYVSPQIIIQNSVVCPGQIEMDEKYFIDEETLIKIENVSSRVALLKKTEFTLLMQGLCFCYTGYSKDKLIEYMESAKTDYEKLDHALMLYNSFSQALLRNSCNVN